MWYACGAIPLAAQGWKLYVPFTPMNAHQVLSAALPSIASAGLHCKYVRTVKLLRKMNAGIFGYTQIGKCLVVYLPQVSEAAVAGMKRVVAPFRDQCPAVPCAIPFGRDLPLYYRYGAYHGGRIELEGEAVDDSREAQAAVPPGIEDELARFAGPVKQDPAVRRLLLRYPVFDAIRQQGKCGIFRAMRLESETFEPVVLKVGYHRGQVQPDGTDGCDFLRRELRFYRLLRRHGLQGLAPKLIDSLDLPRKTILVLEHIEGPSLLDLKLAGNLPVTLLEGCWRMIGQVHERGLYLGDAKIANFLRAPSGQLRLLDFEGAGRLGDPLSTARTFDTKPASAEPRLSDQLHFLASVVYPYESGKYSWQDRFVDLESLRRTRGETPAARWAIAKLNRVLIGFRT